ncbi:hypothetical protein [Ruegeria sp.]
MRTIISIRTGDSARLRVASARFLRRSVLGLIGRVLVACFWGGMLCA